MSTQAVYFSDGEALMRHFRDTACEGNFIYRGQMRRHTCFMPTTEGEQLIDVLFPSDYRFTVQGGRFIPGVPGWVTSRRDALRDRRERFYEFLWEKHAAADPRLTWLDDYRRDVTVAGLVMLFDEPDYLNVENADFESKVRISRKAEDLGLTFSGPSTRSMWALAQHYEITTSMCDWTADPNVAAWFATNPWMKDAPRSIEGQGCIYRIDHQLLADALARFHIFASSQCIDRGCIPPPKFFCEDLSHIPDSCALRPARQLGLSVHGFDQPGFLCWLARPEITMLEIYEFDQASPMEISFTRDYLVPQDDPFLPLVAAFEHGELR